jgi:hypothetical protein
MHMADSPPEVVKTRWTLIRRLKDLEDHCY